MNTEYKLSDEELEIKRKIWRKILYGAGIEELDDIVKEIKNKYPINKNNTVIKRNQFKDTYLKSLT